jgi:hypothetical protein
MQKRRMVLALLGSAWVAIEPLGAQQTRSSVVDNDLTLAGLYISPSALFYHRRPARGHVPMIDFGSGLRMNR